jgi:multiple sugar transport system substrate-binding protein
MIRFTKIASILAVAALSASVLSCGTVTENTTNSGEKETITIAARDGSFTDVINSVKSKFESENNCKIKVVSMSAPDIRTKAIEDASKDVADYDLIMIDDPLMPEYIEKNVLCNLTSLGYADDEDFVEKSRLLGKDPYPLGATYALPFSGNVQLIFYNKDLVDPSADLTNWESILNICEDLKNSGQNGYIIRGQAGNPIVSDFLPILWSFGGDIFDDNNEVILDSVQSREALKFYCNLYSTGDNLERDDLIAAINEGNGAIALGWPSWFISSNGSTAEIEQIPGKKNADASILATGEIGNWLLGVSKKAANKELSLKLAVYLTSADVQKESIKLGGIPTRKSIFHDSSIMEKYPYFEAIYSGTNNSRVRPRTTKWSEIENVFGAELFECIMEHQSIDETIENSQAAIEALMK